ncbi:MAG: two component transcriptional regulator, winged helix family [Conexibacter sp.]|nr:two component transcriptional regulator, winged helix family [Conexibacter sp.]
MSAGRWSRDAAASVSCSSSSPCARPSCWERSSRGCRGTDRSRSTATFRRADPPHVPQFAVLELLIRAEGGVVSAETLLEKVWDVNADPFSSAPRVTMSTLRKALGPPDLIVTVTGAGYRLSLPDRVDAG